MNKSNAKLLQIGSVLDVFDRCWKEFKDDETVVREFDLSSFRNLESLEVCTEFKVRPYDFHRLSQLKELKLNDCECKGLDLSSCHRLEVLDIFGTEITLKPNALNGLAQLKELKLHECECKGLDLSSCHRLEVLDIFRGRIRLTPNALNGLAQLKKLKIRYCKRTQLNLSSCHNLETIDFHGEEGEQIAMPTLSPLMDLHC
ncbi:hypothetical protein DPMN_161823 [Dreissena polymorpha]|uniref:Uncharacterized protein n=1 Tax=Dreissena polymorpha TaxID=45954 RepID=A0A9D4ITR1_DREPO|nr:hypothetical protein DPMN_161823 [Dreissena polymorpha]